jgi:CRISPR-associated endonuclease/helicase Cas3
MLDAIDHALPFVEAGVASQRRLMQGPETPSPLAISILGSVMLLAKSVREGSAPKRLPAHTDDVLRAAEALFFDQGEPSRLGRAWMRLFAIEAQPFDRFWRYVKISILYHDFGKSNDGFQDAVRQDGPQVIRHEHLSALLMAEPDVKSWLASAGLEVGILISSVLSHHLKVSEKSLGRLLEGGRSVLRILSDDDDFKAVWETIRTEVDAASPNQIRFPTRWTASEIRQRADALRQLLRGEKSLLRDDVDRRRFLRAVRSALIVSDAVGSAVTRLPDQIAPWVRDSFPPLLTTDEIEGHVIRPRIDQLRRAGRWDEKKGLSEFQRDIAVQGLRVLLTTPCGSGKTLAAWNWIKAQVDKNPTARVVFLYPTRATATEGFRDYVSWAPESDAALMSGTADYDLQGMFESPDDVRHGRNYQQTDPRLFALGQWRKRIFSATADQFFPFLQYSYGPICLLPLLAESVLVVDEVHSFDRSMFASLKRFLKEFPTIPVLCMTATLPNERRKDLVGECGLRPYPETTPQDLAEVAESPRYQIEWIDRDRAGALARASLVDDRRVLWVVNRVRDCQTAFTAQRDAVPNAPVFCYHSRFKLEDRRGRHNDLVRRFQDAAKDQGPSTAIMGVTTQVCEMSLDLDADVLITEVAPISSLIQRMGRCNRKWPIVLGRIGYVYVIRPESGTEKPYERTELDAATKFIDDLAGRLVSQRDLEKAYEDHDPQQVEPDKHCPFLDSGPYAEAGEESFRDIDEFTVPCVLDKDLDAVLRAMRDRKKPYDGFVVPVPRRFVDESKRPPDACFPRWLSVAPSSHYDPSSGFSDRPRCDLGKETPRP